MGDQGEDLPEEGSEEELPGDAPTRKRPKVQGKRGGPRQKRRKQNYASRLAAGLGIGDSASARALNAVQAAGPSSASSAGSVPVLVPAPPSRPPVPPDEAPPWRVEERAAGVVRVPAAYPRAPATRRTYGPPPAGPAPSRPPPGLERAQAGCFPKHPPAEAGRRRPVGRALLVPKLQAVSGLAKAKPKPAPSPAPPPRSGPRQYREVVVPHSEEVSEPPAHRTLIAIDYNGVLNATESWQEWQELIAAWAELLDNHFEPFILSYMGYQSPHERELEDCRHGIATALSSTRPGFELSDPGVPSAWAIHARIVSEFRAPVKGKLRVLHQYSCRLLVDDQPRNQKEAWEAGVVCYACAPVHKRWHIPRYITEEWGPGLWRTSATFAGNVRVLLDEAKTETWEDSGESKLAAKLRSVRSQWRPSGR